jgi:small subunit ribosomal protein S6
MNLLASYEVMKLESRKEEKKLANRVYELMYIASPDTSEEEVGKLNESIESVIVKGGGTIVKSELIGKKALAYPIRKKNEGIYMLFEIESSGQEIAEIERRLRVNDVVMRFITVRVDEDRKAADKVRAKREKRIARKDQGASASVEG